ncbi:MAG: hypothetical protein E7404_04485 [Ruminococcaceae bacterium]|nr:hypothetical protein [Oscillospiraceae bacterium]
MAQTGKLFVRTTISKAQIPIMNAHVSIIKQENDKKTLLKSLRTDENGKTITVDFEVPDAQNSLNSENTDERFFVCDIIITHPDYYTTYIKNVQIFANQISVQEINLIPLEEDVDPAGFYESIDITSQNL